MNENSFSKGRGRRRKIRSVKTSSPCSLRETIMSTFNSEYGYLDPTTVSVKRCFGGNKDPVDIQCQPKKKNITCFRLRQNTTNTEHFLGYLEHEDCEENCICNRNSNNCKGKELKEMLCPVG